MIRAGKCREGRAAERLLNSEISPNRINDFSGFRRKFGEPLPISVCYRGIVSGRWIVVVNEIVFVLFHLFVQDIKEQSGIGTDGLMELRDCR